MMLAHLDATDHPDLAARDLLRQFDGNLAHVENHIALHLLAEALRRDDYESYLHWRTVGSLCVELAGDAPRPVIAASKAADRLVVPA